MLINFEIPTYKSIWGIYFGISSSLIRPPPSHCNIFKSILCADIHCLRTPTQERFTAFLRVPSGFNSAPVLEDVRHELLNPSVGGEECLVGAVETTPGLFALDLSRLSECGVRQCAVENEEDWLCVMVRWVAGQFHGGGYLLLEPPTLPLLCSLGPMLPY